MSEISNSFSNNKTAGMTLRAAIVFGIAATVLSVLAAPTLQSYSEQYAETQGYGVDRVMTGSIKKTKRYTLHKSVLLKKPVQICADGQKRDAC